MNVHRISLQFRPLLFGSQRAIHGRKSDKQSFAVSVDHSQPNDRNSLVTEEANKSLSLEEGKDDKELSFWQKYNQAMGYLRPSADYIAKVNKRWDVSAAGFRRWLQRRLYMQSVKEQTFVPERHGHLGSDLSAATFVLQNRGRVQFNNKQWMTDVKLLPTDYTPEYKLTAIDAKGNWLLYEGIENLIQLKFLREMNISNNSYIDDWCCDLLSRIHRHSKRFETLDISGCKRVSERGVASLVKIPSLRKLNIAGTKASESEHLELLTFLCSDINPNCEIITLYNKLLQ